LRFAITFPPSGCEEDFHLQAVKYARHTMKTARAGSASRRSSANQWKSNPFERVLLSVRAGIARIDGSLNQRRVR
jgi:hypothetical protein